MGRAEVRKILGDAKELKNLNLVKIQQMILAFAMFFIIQVMNVRQLKYLIT